MKYLYQYKGRGRGGGRGRGRVYCFQLVRDFVILDFFSAHYLENDLMKFDQILHMHLR